MKKLIALISLGLSFGFALALANTEDSAMNHDTTTENSNMNTDSHQQAGTAGMTGDTTNPNMEGDTTLNTSDTKISESKVSKICTDDKGVMLRTGQKGFKECMQMEKNKHNDQMGGISDSGTENTYQSKEVYRNTPSPTPTTK